MSLIDEKFAQLKRDGKKAFLPFLTAGDPSLAMTVELLKVLQEAGCAMAEVGVPYSDPIADGPIIQESYTKALNAGIKLGDIYKSVASVKDELRMPLLSMVSYSIIHRVGFEKFLTDSQHAGFSGSIVPDLLIEEGQQLRDLCKSKDYSLIHLVTPTTPKERMLEIAAGTTGFIYFVSITGITGERNELPASLLDQVAWLRERTELPICIGFGISSVEHVRMLAPVADGLIVGSAIVRRLAEHVDSPTAAVQSVRELATELVEALDEVAAA